MLFKKYIKFGDTKPRLSSSSTYTVLVSREEKVTNLWHEMMEMLSVSMTLDAMRITRRPDTNELFLTTSIAPRIAILDPHAEGPFWDLWNLFAPGGVIRKPDLNTKTFSDSNIIVPLPGGSNPFWQGDWEAHACSPSPVLSTFSNRILDFYKIPRDKVIDDRPLVFTFIDRREKRRLIHKEQYLDILRAKYPNLKIQFIDSATGPFAEQIRIASESDILAGVHGAGLTHAMFQRPGSALVEIVPKASISRDIGIWLSCGGCCILARMQMRIYRLRSGEREIGRMMIWI